MSAGNEKPKRFCQLATRIRICPRSAVTVEVADSSAACCRFEMGLQERDIKRDVECDARSCKQLKVKQKAATSLSVVPCGLRIGTAPGRMPVEWRSAIMTGNIPLSKRGQIACQFRFGNADQRRQEGNLASIETPAPVAQKGQGGELARGAREEQRIYYPDLLSKALKRP